MVFVAADGETRCQTVQSVDDAVGCEEFLCHLVTLDNVVATGRALFRDGLITRYDDIVDGGAIIFQTDGHVFRGCLALHGFLTYIRELQHIVGAGFRKQEIAVLVGYRSHV